MAKIGVLWQADSADELASAYRDILIKTLGGLGYIEGKTANSSPNFGAFTCTSRGIVGQ
jgi:hypothetical protein